MTFNQRSGIRWRMADEDSFTVTSTAVNSTTGVQPRVEQTIGYEKTLRFRGYDDGDILIYTRIGPRSRAIIYNCETKLDLKRLIGEFDSKRERPDPIWVSDGRGGGDYIPQPLPSIYGSAQGDEEFSTFLYNKAPRRKFAPVETPTSQGERKIDIGEREVRPTKEIGRDIDL